MKKFTGITGFLGSGRKNGFLGRSPAIMLEYRTLGMVGWFQVFCCLNQDFQDLRIFRIKGRKTGGI